MVCDEAVVADVRSTLADLRTRQAENRDRYADDAAGSSRLPDEGEFQGLPFLVAPVTRFDQGDRPIPPRPDGSPQVPGSNPVVLDAGGTRV